jgi:hypothetical protein
VRAVTTARGGAPGRGTPGPSVRVSTANGVTQVVSSPYPIHYADVTLSRTLGRWLVTVHTARVHVRDFSTLPDALHHAGTVVGTLYRVDMRSRFTGPQRHALALGQCPRHVDCADLGSCSIARPDHRHICRKGADFQSIWCITHNRTGGDGR